VMVKRIDAVGSWLVSDGKRGSDVELYPDTSGAEATNTRMTFSDDGFTHLTTQGNNNASGGEYLYHVIYDTNKDGGDSYYDEYVGEHNASFTPSNYVNTADRKLEWSLNDGVTWHEAIPSGASLTSGVLTTSYEPIEDLTVGNRDIKTKLTLKGSYEKITKLTANIYKQG